MTRNQILYRQNVETERSNRAGEALTAARDAETKRSHLATEFETNRSNVAREQETLRSNLARELETNRHNISDEALTAQRNKIQASYNAGYLGELNRSNLARELETTRHNLEAEDLQSAQQKVELQKTKYAADTSADAQRYSADQRFAGSVYSADSSKQATRYVADQRVAQQELANASALAVEQLRQQGYNERQLKQIAADAAYVLHNDVVKLIESGAGAGTVRRLVDDYYLRQLRKE